MSLDFRSATLPYKSSSFATPEGGSLLSASLRIISKIPILVISHLRWLSPFDALRHHLSP